MPTDRPNDSAARPSERAAAPSPRSPTELDRRIMQHARARAKEYADYSGSTGYRWLGDGWKTAVGAFSVAVLAIAVTIQVFDYSQQVDFSAPRAIPVEESSVADTQEMLLPDPADNPTPQLTDEDAAVSLAFEARDSSRLLERREERRASTADTTLAAAGAAAASAPAQPLPQPESFASTAVTNTSATTLEALLASLPVSQSAAAARARSASTDNRLETLGNVLNFIELVFNDSSIQIGPLVSTGQSTLREQLQNRAQILALVYLSYDNPQIFDRLEQSFQQLKGDFQAVSMPPTLNETLEIIDGWSSGR